MIRRIWEVVSFSYLGTRGLGILCMRSRRIETDRIIGSMVWRELSTGRTIAIAVEK